MYEGINGGKCEKIQHYLVNVESYLFTVSG